MVRDSFIREKLAYFAEVSVTEQILWKISKFPEILGELSMRKQCVPGSFLSAHALEPGNKASYYSVYSYFTAEAVGASQVLPAFLFVWLGRA